MIGWFFGLLSSAQWDAWRNWLTTIGGPVALLIATNTYRRNGKIKREEQAWHIYSKFIHVKHHVPGTTFPLLPNDAQIGNGSQGLQIVSNPDPKRK